MFGWRLQREKKASGAGRVFAFSIVGRPVWPQRNYATFAEEGYRKNVIAFAAVDTIARAIGSAPWRLFRGTNRQDFVTDHPLLRLINRPNPIMGRAEFFENVAAYYLIAGNSYIEAVGPDGGLPLELWPLRPDRMSVLPGDTGLPAGFTYTLGQKKKRWVMDTLTGQGPILHWRKFNPLDDWYGLSPLEAAADDIAIRNSTGAWNKALVDNSGRPSGALIYDPADGVALGDDQREIILNDLERRFTGSENAGRPMLMEGNFKWEQMGLSPTDMDWLESKNSSGRDIATAFGVPPMLVGIQGAQTFTNYREARLALWEETVIPLIRNLRDELNMWLVPQFGDDLHLDLDLDDAPALTLRREKKFNMIERSTFLTINEKRKELGFDEITGGDQLFVPLNLVPLDEAGDRPEDDPDEDEARGLTAIPEGGTTPDDALRLQKLGYGDHQPPRPNGQAA